MEDPSNSTVPFHSIQFHSIPLHKKQDRPQLWSRSIPLGAAPSQHEQYIYLPTCPSQERGLWPRGFWVCMRWGCEIGTERIHWVLRQKMGWRDPRKAAVYLSSPLASSIQGLAQLKHCKLQRKPRMTNNCRNLKNQVPLDFMGSVVLNIPTCLSEGKWAINSSPVVIKRM